MSGKVEIGPSGESSPVDSGYGGNGSLKVRGEVILVPQPSDDSRDPLNWSQAKKYSFLFILTLAAFTGHSLALANQLGFTAQANVYHKSLTEISYTISSAVAGIAAGPLFAVPLTHIFGRTSVLFWSSVACIAFSIWSALMTKPDQYIEFTVSRLFVGIFSATPIVVGPQMLVDMFFLHERGRSFNTFFVFSSLGTVVGPTLGGFIVEHLPWPWQFWWNIILQGMVVVLIFFFIEETGFTRKDGRIFPSQPKDFMRNRIATFFPGTAVTHQEGFKEASHSATTPFLIGISPVTVLGGCYLLCMSGWFVSLNTLMGVFLQTPVEEGGYGFTAQRSAAFTFTFWVAIVAAHAWGYFVNDRIPLMISKRASGAWKPEYRLHALWIPSLILMPAGLALFGCSLQYHLHYMVLAVGAFLVCLSSNMVVPVVLNYLVECFMNHPIELNCITTLYRLSLGLGIPFFIDPWVAKVGAGWVFGMMAFFTLASFVPIALMMQYGHRLRVISFGKLNKDEEGVQIVQKTAD